METGAAGASTSEDRHQVRVVENAHLHRFELPLGEDALAAAYYRVDGNRLVLTHTEVPSEFAGRGIGTRLATEVFEQIRASGRKAVLRCPFMIHFAARHPDYADVIDG